MATQPLWGWPFPVPNQSVTKADLERLPDDGAKYELYRGVLLRMPPPKKRHENIIGRISSLIFAYLEQHGLDDHYAGGAGYDMTLPGQDDTVLAPDVSVTQYPETSEDYSKIPPLLAVEVVSPSQFRPAMAMKAQFYLSAGVKLVWIVWPDSRTVDVWTPPQQVTTLTFADIIDGGEVLPGFSCPVAKFFPKQTA